MSEFYDADPIHPAWIRPSERRRRGRVLGEAMVRLTLGLVLVALAGVVLLASSHALDAAGAAVANSPRGLIAAPSARPTAVAIAQPVSAPPILIAPGRLYTNIGSVTLRGRLPIGLKRGTGEVRIYRQAKPPILVAAVAVGALPEFTVSGVKLLPGINLFTATISGSGGESAPSAPVRYVYELVKPQITVLAPASGATVRATTIAVIGHVPAGSHVVIRNLANSTGSAVAVDAQGTFTSLVALALGTNGLAIEVIDRAGNQNSMSLTVVRKAGKGR